MQRDQQPCGDQVVLFQAAATNDFLAMKTLLQREDVDPTVRGSLGETILHTAILNGHKEVLKVILECAPSLMTEPMTYKGETSLYTALQKKDLEIIKLLLKTGADLSSRPSCSSCASEMECTGMFYFGEYPLSFAACAGSEEIMKLLLVDYGAPLNAQDSLGNTVFHILVLQQNKELACHIYDLILDLLPLRESQCAELLENNDGFTPLKLAANEGNIEMFSYLVKRQKKIYWTIGTISYSIYDLANIDTWRDQKSVLQIITSSQKPQESYECTEDYLRLAGELITLFGAIFILLIETPLLIKLGPVKYIGNASTGGPFSLLMVGYSLLIFSVAVLRVLGHEGEAIPLSLALIIGWCNSIYFARGFKMLGQFSIMIQKIIFADLLCWFCLVFIIIIGFSSAFYVMNQVMDLENNITVPDFAKTLYGSIEMMMGLTNLEVPTATSCPMIYVVYSVFMLLVYLLLLNMLIAMMENTYWRVAQEREELWKIQVAATILLLESHLPRFLTVRTGIPGSCLGLDDKKWYLGVEEILDDYMPERNKLPEGLCTKSTLCWNKIRRNISLIISMNDNTEITVL
ncbi:transient receptor potential cation channel subfamily V member 5-like isoform X3 [Hyperolius riggenbachi]|uniref:transient receptor potential cation channel subfamily V member 5-like isoform X3 n=1 Tax=Hyperolius riggenbachi TaxID=752182 RepID=UPI0035A37025